MCWVACDRLAAIAGLLGARRAGRLLARAGRKIRKKILERAWSDKRGAIVGAFDHDDLDASALLVAELGLLRASDERFVQDRATSSARS